MVRIRYCFYCGKKLSRRIATKDHVIPKSKGGGDSYQNIVNCCRDCNESKGNLLPNEFRVVMAFRAGYVKVHDFKFPGECTED